MSADWIDQERIGGALIPTRLRRAKPFGHVVIDDAVPAATCERLVDAVSEEAAGRMVDEIYELLATEEPLTHPDLLAFQSTLEAALRPGVSEAIGEPAGRLSLRGYRFAAGHYLLPHADADGDDRRQLGVVIYLAASDDLEGGDLELFETVPGPPVDPFDFARTISSGAIAPRPGRLVLLDVGPKCLHQVREVEAGSRVSLSGWFRREDEA